MALEKIADKVVETDLLVMGGGICRLEYRRALPGETEVLGVLLFHPASLNTYFPLPCR